MYNKNVLLSPKNTQWNLLWNPGNVLTRTHRKNKRTLCTSISLEFSTKSELASITLRRLLYLQYKFWLKW